MTLIIIAIGLVALAMVLAACGKDKPEPDIQDGPSSAIPVDGGRNEYYESGYSEDIKSTDITAFSLRVDAGYEYEYGYTLKCEKERDDSLHVEAEGGNPYERDGSAFSLDYYTNDLTLLSELQKIVEKYELSKDNGHVGHTAGLPECGGQTLSVDYVSGEGIYRSENSGPILDREASDAIYDAFLASAQEEGLDFTTEGSNQLIYDDATEEFLQGTWKGDHFGHDCVVEFSGNHVVITIDGSVTDDCGYVITDGRIVPDNDEKYPKFSGMSTMTKAYSGLTAHFYENGASSSTNLIKEN